MATPAPDPALVARFADDLTAAAGAAWPGEGPLALAVSGGPDSMAMLVLAAAAWPGRIIAATVDHGLRADAAEEAAMVADYCATVGVVHRTLTPAAAIERTNLHANARAVRYALLGEWALAAGAGLLATAHHADDQAETFLMRAARGSGVAGLAGVRVRQQWRAEDTADAAPLVIVRPLLGWRRGELRALAGALRLPFVDDPSNDDPRFDRARFRALLAAAPDLDAVNLARAAEHAAQADDTIRAFERWLWDDRRVPVADNIANPDQQCWLNMQGLPRDLKRRLARAAIDQLRRTCGIDRPDFTPATNIEPLLDALESGKTATQAGILVAPQGQIWCFSKAPPRRAN